MAAKNYGALPDELFYKRLDDLLAVSNSRRIPRFSFFYNETEQALADKYLSGRCGGSYLFYGGHEDAVRRILGVFPDTAQPSLELFPVTALSFSFPKGQTLTHRDFLGALMALRVKREAVGDIIIEEGNAAVFIHTPLASFVLGELNKVGRVGVKAVMGISFEFDAKQKTRPVSGTVSSMRLDCVVAMLTGRSREDAACLIEKAMVFLNYTEASKRSTGVGPGDIITIRGYGKYLITDEIRATKKGRISLTANQYC